ncbi:MAG: hypothetical protein NVS9B15_24410 [Acidobacteriaceae bacterium]
METSLRVLFIGSSDHDARPLVEEFERKGYKVDFERVDTRSQLTVSLPRGWDVVLGEYGGE